MKIITFRDDRNSASKLYVFFFFFYAIKQRVSDVMSSQYYKCRFLEKKKKTQGAPENAIFYLGTVNEGFFFKHDSQLVITIR